MYGRVYGYGYGDRVGTGRGYTGYHPAAKGGPTDSEAGPEGPAGAWSGGPWGRNTQVFGGGTDPTLRARSAPLQGTSLGPLRMPPLGQ